MFEVDIKNVTEEEKGRRRTSLDLGQGSDAATFIFSFIISIQYFFS